MFLSFNFILIALLNSQFISLFLSLFPIFSSISTFKQIAPNTLKNGTFGQIKINIFFLKTCNISFTCLEGS